MASFENFRGDVSFGMEELKAGTSSLFRVTTKSQLGAIGVHSVNSVIRRMTKKANKM